MRRAAPPKGPGGPRPAVGSFLPAALRAGVRGRADNGPCRGSASLIPSEARDQVAAILAFVDGDGACDIAECGHGAPTGNWIAVVIVARSEEHTSELQSLMRISYAVFCLKKKKIQQIIF